jgi:isoquinoline 1-oxidoreductase beta subunit
VDIAVDCGATVNPERAQMEGACVMVKRGTLWGNHVQGWPRTADNFSNYRTRMPAAPIRDPVQYRAGDYDKPMGGVGEPGRRFPAIW